MADDNSSSWKFDLDISSFADQAEKAKGMVQDLGDSGGENLSGLTSKLMEAGLAAGALGTAFIIAKESLNLVEEGENIQKINDQFQLLAENAGFAGDTIKNKLIHAAEGFATDTEVLKAANQEIVKLGSNAQQLPEIMELARKASQVMGGSVIENFQNISNAIAGGNARMLKHLGLNVDVVKAQQDYAQSIGKTVAMLSEEEKQHALLEATLEKGNKQYANLNENLETSTQKIEKLKTAFKELGEGAAIVWEKIAGPTTRSWLDSIAEKVSYIGEIFKSKYTEGTEQVENQKKAIESEITLLKEQIDYGMQYGKDVSQINERLKDREAALVKINALEEKHNELALHKAQASGSDGMVAPTGDNKKVLIEQNKLNLELVQMRMKRAKDEEDVAKVSFDKQGVAEYESDIKINQQIVLLHKQTQLQIEQINLDNTQTDQIRRMKIQEIERKDAADTIKLEDGKNKARLKSLDEYLSHSKSTADGISRAFLVSANKSIQASQDFGKKGTMVFDALNKHASSAFKALGDGSMNAAQAMRSAMFGAIGDIATAQGEELLATGIGTLNPVAVAEGGVLIALGSALSSMGSGSTGVPSGSGGSSGGATSSASVATQTTSTTPPAAQAEKKSVSINIMGSLFETEQTKTRLVEMIRDASDATDFSFKQIGQK